MSASPTATTQQKSATTPSCRALPALPAGSSFSLVGDHTRLIADAAERNARQMAETRRQELYAAQMTLAHQAWSDGDLERAQNLLARTGANETDLRDFEWRYLWQLCRDDTLVSGGDDKTI